MAEMCDEEKIELVIARSVAPRLSGIEAKLEVFTQIMNQISSQFTDEKASNKETRKELQSELEEIKKILNGNGKDGLVATVNKLIDWVENQKKLQWIIIGAVIVELIGMGFLILRMFINFS